MAEGRLPEPLRKEEWDFRNLTFPETRAACIWEYARESETLKAGHLPRIDPHLGADRREILTYLHWFQSLGISSFQKPWLLTGRQGFIAPAVSNAAFFAPSQVVSETRPIIPSSFGPVQELVEGRKPYFGDFTLRLEIDLRASESEIRKQIRKLIKSRTPSIDDIERAKGKKSETRWADRLDWLAVMRLKREFSPGELRAVMLNAASWLKNRQSPTLSRQLTQARSAFREMFWFLPEDEIPNTRKSGI